MSEPRFKVGDFVVSKAQKEAIRLYPSRYAADRPVVFQVTDVQLQTCYAGTQANYLCRGAGRDRVGLEMAWFNDVELDPAPTEPAAEDPASPWDNLARLRKEAGDIRREAEGLADG